MKRVFIVAAVITAIFASYYFYNPLGAKVRIGESLFAVDVAVTEPQKQKGLGGRETLENDRGMLFVYDHRERYEFWMRNMRFALDIVWIDNDTVADITTHVPPPSETGGQPRIVTPNTPVDKVLELNAGAVEQFGISVGDTVEFIDK